MNALRALVPLVLFAAAQVWPTSVQADKRIKLYRDSTICAHVIFDDVYARRIGIPNRKLYELSMAATISSVTRNTAVEDMLATHGQPLDDNFGGVPFNEENLSICTDSPHDILITSIYRPRSIDNEIRWGYIIKQGRRSRTGHFDLTVFNPSDYFPPVTGMGSDFLRVIGHAFALNRTAFYKANFRVK